MDIDWQWMLDHLDDLAARTVQHLWLTLIAVFIGFLISFFLAILAVRRRATYGPILGVTDILYTIPSLALFAALVSITGITLFTVEIPLVMYTLVIYVRNIATGFDTVPADVLEAANGMGYTRTQRLWRVEVPLAVPLIVAGLRLATVSTIGLVTVIVDPGRHVRRPGLLHPRGLQAQLPDRAVLRGDPLDPAGHRARCPSDPRPGARHSVDAPGRGRGDDLMNIVNETIAWLTDPAHWVGPNGIPARMTEQVIISGRLAHHRAGHRHPGRAVHRSHRAAHELRGQFSEPVARASVARGDRDRPAHHGQDRPRVRLQGLPTVIAMVVLAVPPILVNTYSALRGVDRDILEAGRGQGMAEGQVLRRIELPLSVPVITIGIRSAAIQVIATATLGAVFGFGGLGRYLVNGMSQNDQGQIFGGVVLVASLVIVTELLFVVGQRWLTPRGLRS